ncbi:MAG TPA: DUF2911 domain-containing protein [Acidobacteriota bacterium]
MKRISAFSCALLLLAGAAWAQGSPRGKAEVTLNGDSIAIDYGRPSLRGRDMLGRAEVGQTWRMGADSATTLTTEADLSFGPVELKAGKYTLTAKKVEAGKWHLIASGAEIHEIPLQASELSESVEIFTIELSGEAGSGAFKMIWGITALTAPFSAN